MMWGFSNEFGYFSFKRADRPQETKDDNKTQQDQNFQIINFKKKFGSENSIPKYQSTPLNLLTNSHVQEMLTLIPKLFTLTTKNGSFHFNTFLLKDTSSVIKEKLEQNPEISQFHLDINDPEKVLGKFEKMYRGEFVVFDEDELPISHKITKILNITCCPNFLKPESLKRNDFSSSTASDNHTLGVQVDFNGIKSYFQNKSLKSFTIKTNKKEYKCNSFGVYLSAKILAENPNFSTYVYNFEDEFDEFQPICDLFNFESVVLTRDNMDSIKEIVEDLQINSIIDEANKIINSTEKVSKAIDEQQAIIDSIDELFNLLYSIREKTVESVRKEICQSKWIKTEDKVKELVAFIIQVVKADFVYHSYIFDLLVQLDKCQNESNKLNILFPFVIKQLMSYFDDNSCISYENHIKSNQLQIYGFIFRLYKRGFLPKNELYKKLEKIASNRSFVDNSSIGSSYNSLKVENILNIILYFLPELMEIDESFISLASSLLFGNNNNYFNNYQYTNRFFLRQFYPNKIEDYKRIRDREEPEDEITNALRNDDVDKVQSILSKSEVNVSKLYIPFNIFENSFIKKINYLNYAALYGSIKCFKYLLLNHCKINRNTFFDAVQGGNNEIIKIVEQKENENDFQNNDDVMPYSFDLNTNLNTNLNAAYYPELESTIKRHQNDLFDWILYEKCIGKDLSSENLSNLVICSVENGNAHSLIAIIDKGFNLLDNTEIFQYIIQLSAFNGFYKLTQLIFNLVGENPNFKFENMKSYLQFENTSIFNLFLNLMNQNETGYALRNCICTNNVRLIKFFIEKYPEKSSNVFNENAYHFLAESIRCKSNGIFYLLLDHIVKIIPEFYTSFNDFYNLVRNAIEIKNTEVAKFIINIIIDNNRFVDFTSIFSLAAESNVIEICQMLVDKKIPIHYAKFVQNCDVDLSFLNEELFTTVFNNVSLEDQAQMLGCLEKAIIHDNKVLVKILLKKSRLINNSLFLAVETNDLELVDIILQYNSKPSFINQRNNKGTALSIATRNNNLPIVQRLLSLPGINPSLYSYSNKTPLLIAVDNNNLEIIKAIIYFCEKDIQKWEIYNAIMSFFQDNMSCKDKAKAEILNFFLEKKLIDPNLLVYDSTLLTFAAENEDIELVKNLLKYDDIDTNMYESKKGNTPLIIAVEHNNYDIAKLLIDHPKTNINIANYENNTPLTIAAENSFINIVELLINNEKFDPEESLIDQAFYLSKGECSKLLCKVESLDVNYETKDKDKGAILFGSYNSFSYMHNNLMGSNRMILNTLMPLIKAVGNNDLIKVDCIIEHPSFDKFRSRVKLAIKISIIQNKVDIFQKLLKIFDNGVNMIDSDGKNLIDYALMNSNLYIIPFILNNPNFDQKKIDFVNSFILLCSLDTNKIDKMNLIEQFYKYDQEHNRMIDFTKLLPNGKSFFTIFYHDSNVFSEMFDFFEENGADPDAPDEFGVYPLQHAACHHIYSLVIKLINSDRVDLTRRFSNLPTKCTTYLHMLSNIYVPDLNILQTFLEKSGIDINTVDENGDTALILSVRAGLNKNVLCLFEKQDLDYLHRNNSGEDALSVALLHCNNQFKSLRTENRDEYYDLLIHAMIFDSSYLINFQQNHNGQNDDNDNNNGYQNLNDGFQNLNNGFQNLNNGFQNLNNGFQNPNNGFQNLNNGFQNLNNGFQNLNNGFQNLQNVNHFQTFNFNFGEPK